MEQLQIQNKKHPNIQQSLLYAPRTAFSLDIRRHLNFAGNATFSTMQPHVNFLIADVGAQVLPMLIAAARGGNTARLKQLLEGGSAPNQVAVIYVPSTCMMTLLTMCLSTL